MRGLDLKDKKLLVALSQNARASQAQLGKAVGLSKSAIPGRIERLQKKNVIRSFATVVNFDPLGYKMYTVFLKVDTVDGFFDYFCKHPFGIWSCRLLGGWDFHIEVIAKNIDHFNSILMEMLAFFGDSLLGYETHMALEVYKVEHLPGVFVSGVDVEKLPLSSRKWKENVTLDIVGRKLLHALNVDASLPLHMLAKQCGCTLDVVHYRMKTLFKQGVILQYIPFVSLQALGYEEYYCNVSLRHLTFEKAATLKQFLISSGHVKFAFRGASRLEVLFLLAVRTTLELDTFLKEFKSLFSEHILSLDAMLVTEQGPLGWFPKGLVDDHSQK